MKTRLQPIEKPCGILKKIAYWYTKMKIGKVITPMKVIYSRLPVTCGIILDRIIAMDSQLSIDEELALLLRIHVAQINVCGFCIDIAKADSIKKFRNQDKFYNLPQYRSSPMFSAREKAALEYAEELTRFKKISDPVFQQAQNHFSDKQLTSISWIISTEHLFNVMNLSFDIESDGLCMLSNKNEKKLTIA